MGKDGNLHPFHTVVRHSFLPHTLQSCRLGSNKAVYTLMKLFAIMTMYLIPSMNFAIGPPLPLSGIQQIFGGRGLRVWVLRWVLGKHATQSVETGALFHTLVGRTSRNQTTAVNINMCGVLRIEEVLGESGRKAPGHPEQWGRESPS